MISNPISILLKTRKEINLINLLDRDKVVIMKDVNSLKIFLMKIVLIIIVVVILIIVAIIITKIFQDQRVEVVFKA